jgi:methylphosphotriester-DNA--protein-cysteine methyltransferase
MSLPQTSRGNACYRPVISLARFGIRPASRRTNGCSGAGSREAHALLRDGRLSLAEIARACGFADQSHFTKAYARLRGISPGAWRRQQEIAPKS